MKMKAKNNSFPVRVAGKVAMMGVGSKMKTSTKMTRYAKSPRGPFVDWAKKEGPGTKYAKTRKL